MEVYQLYRKIKFQDISNVKQKEDKYSRFDYSKLRVDILSGITGVEGNMKDCR